MRSLPDTVTAIDPTTEELFTLRAACRLPELKRNSKALHVATVYRWATRGVRGITLETFQQGSARVTSREAIDRFFSRLSRGQKTEPEAALTRTPLRRQRDHVRAEQQLSASGW